jgi:hypothetical protein
MISGGEKEIMNILFDSKLSNKKYNYYHIYLQL